MSSVCVTFFHWGRKIIWSRILNPTELVWERQPHETSSGYKTRISQRGRTTLRHHMMLRTDERRFPAFSFPGLGNAWRRRADPNRLNTNKWKQRRRVRRTETVFHCNIYDEASHTERDHWARELQSHRWKSGVLCAADIFLWKTWSVGSASRSLCLSLAPPDPSLLRVAAG